MTPLAPPLVIAASVVLLAVSWSWAARADDARHARGRLHLDRPAPVGPPGWFTDGVVRLRVGVDAGRAWTVARVAGGTSALWLAWASPSLAAVVILSAGVGLLLGPPLVRRRRHGIGDDGLDSVIGTVIAELGSGSSLLQGLDRAAEDQGGELGRELSTVVRRARQGAVLQASLDVWVTEAPGPARSLFVDALALAGASGGSQVHALRGVASTLRERDELRREIVALGSQARASAAVLVVTPVAFAAVVGLADPAVGRFLLSTPAGWACLLTGATLDAVGAWWMHRLVGALR